MATPRVMDKIIQFVDSIGITLYVCFIIAVSFCGFGFISLYLGAQMKIFVRRGRSLPLVVSLFPLIFASLVAISRTCDYHHHWQDVTVGSILGFGVILLIYHQYFPSLLQNDCDKPHFQRLTSSPERDPTSTKVYGRRPLLLDQPTGVKTV